MYPNPFDSDFTFSTSLPASAAVQAELRDITIHTGDVSSRASTVGDRRELVSVVANLLDNAVKYSPPGSTVELRAGTDGATVTIEVEDHGLGVTGAQATHRQQRLAHDPSPPWPR